MKHAHQPFSHGGPRRTSVIVDGDQLDEAARVLGTRTTTETIRRALADVIVRARRRELATWDLDEMSLNDLDALRRARTR